MGGKTSVPPPTEAEQQLQTAQAEQLKMQTQILQQQQEQQKVLLPFLAEQQGFDVQMDDKGNITGITKRADPLEDQSKELQAKFNQRSLDALAGNLPVDPALEKSLTLGEQQLREKLQTQFGSGYETASPAIEALTKYQANAESLRYGARTDQLSLAEQLGLARTQQNTSATLSQEDVLNQSAVGTPLTFAGAFGQVARGYGQAQQSYLAQRQMQTQASTANSDRLYRLFGAGISAGGQLGSAMMMFSDEDIKGDLVVVSRLSELPIYEYTLKTTGERMLGVLSSEVKAIMPHAVPGTRGGFDVVDYEAI